MNTAIRRSLAAALVIGAAATSACAAPALAAEPTGGSVGLFLGCFQSEGMPGATNLNLALAFNAPAHTDSGSARVTQATNPPLDIHSNVDGTYSVMTVMPNTTHIQVRVTGYPPVNWPSGGGIGPVIMPNLDAVMVLDKDWQKGTVQYSYANGAGQGLGPVVKQSIKQVPCSTSTN